MSQDEILTSVEGSLGVITLNRPKAVNALTHDMIGQLDRALTEFESNDDVHAVLVQGAGDRGLCSGGDVVSIHDNAVNNDLQAAVPFFREEYTLNNRIYNYPKPYIAIMNGLVLGGGVGISSPGSHRVATDSTKLGMPEVGIGFSPDVGGVYFLANAPESVGKYMALTGSHVSGPDAVYAGMADVHVPDDHVNALIERLQTITDPGQVDEVLADFDQPGGSLLSTESPWINYAFGSETVEEIISGVQSIADQDNEMAKKALKALQRHSPTGLKVALEAVNRAKDLNFAEVLVQDLRTTMHAVEGDDLAEGIRAQIIDKDRNPQWNPAHLSDVTDAAVAGFFEPVDGVEDLALN